MLVALLAFLWYFKCTNLPKLYYTISQKVCGITVDYLRGYEDLQNKLKKTSLDIEFLLKCKDLDTFPKFSNFRITFISSIQTLKQLKRRALHKEIRSKQQYSHRLNNLIARRTVTLERNLSILQFYTLKALLKLHLKRLAEQWSANLDRKLQLIWIRGRTEAPERSIINKSDYSLSLYELNALRLGLKHCITPPRVDNVSIQCSFEKFCQLSLPKVNVQDRNEFVNQLRFLSSSYLCNAVNETNAHYNKSLHRTLRSLRKNNAIKICKFDKGNGTIVLNSSEYFEKLDEIINTDKFIEIPISHNENHPIIKTENSIQYFLRKYIRPFVSDDAYKLIYPVGSRPGALYGLAKVHKDNIPLRPVISMIGTPNTIWQNI